MKIILATINAKWIHPSMALRLLKANLGEFEEECEILEFALRQPLEEKIRPILSAQPRLLGISVSVWNHPGTLELLKEMEKLWEAGQRPIVVLGGPEVSWLQEEAEIFHFADYVIRGEGEESFRSLCHDVFYGKRLEPDTLFGATNVRHTIFINQGDTSVDVNKIASPYRLYTDEDLDRKLVYVEASRGCPFGCEFCQGSAWRQSSACRQGQAGSVREFTLEPFLAEMAALVNRGARTFKFLDRTFNLNMDRVTKIVEFFLDRIETIRTGKGKQLCVHFEMVPFLFPMELKELLRRFPPGSLRLELGIQTLNPATAKLVNSAGRLGGQQVGQELENLEFLRRETFATLHVDLIAGLPGEDLVSFGAGFDRLWKILMEAGSQHINKSFEIQLGILKCLPGTPMVRHNRSYGMRYSPGPPYELIETGVISETELNCIKNFARFWEIIVNRNPFPEILGALLRPGKPVFGKFMFLSDRLLERFGRNWGIARYELRSAIEEILADVKSTAAGGEG